MKISTFSYKLLKFNWIFDMFFLYFNKPNSMYLKQNLYFCSLKHCDWL